MEIRNVGASGLRVSFLGLGCNNFGWRIELEESRKVVHKALDLGITLFDTADVYDTGRSEEMLGESLGARRKEVVIATKFASALNKKEGGPFASRRYIMGAVEDSLRRLRTDWIDLYQYHWPDPRTPLDETLRALDDLVHQGKVRYIGASNLPAWKVVESAWLARTSNLNAYISCQDEYSLVARDIERDLIPAMRAHGLGLLPYFPLAAGLLTGKYKRGAAPAGDTRFASQSMGGLGNRYMTEANWAVVEKLDKFAGERGHTLLELAFAWFAANPTVSSVIAGATRPEQLEQNVKALEWTLTAAEYGEVNSLSAK